MIGQNTIYKLKLMEIIYAISPNFFLFRLNHFYSDSFDDYSTVKNKNKTLVGCGNIASF